MTASFVYHDPPDVPPGMTLSEYRLLLGELRRPRRRARVKVSARLLDRAGRTRSARTAKTLRRR